MHVRVGFQRGVWLTIICAIHLTEFVLHSTGWEHQGFVGGRQRAHAEHVTARKRGYPLSPHACCQPPILPFHHCIDSLPTRYASPPISFPPIIPCSIHNNGTPLLSCVGKQHQRGTAQGRRVRTQTVRQTSGQSIVSIALVDAYIVLFGAYNAFIVHIRLIGNIT